MQMNGPKKMKRSTSRSKVWYLPVVQDLERFWELLITLVQKDLKVKYKHTWFGYLWSLLLPIAQAMVFYVVFKLVIRLQVDQYLLFVLSGLFVWQWIASTIQLATGSFLSNASIIKKLRFERSVLVLSTVCIDMIHFVLTLPVLAVVMFVYGKSLHWFAIIEIPLVLGAQCLLLFGVSLIVATVNLYFRDLERIVVVALMVAFYLTPVIYPAHMVPEHYKWLLNLNPAAVLVDIWHSMVIDGRPAWELTMLAWVYGLVSLGLGMIVYRRFEWRIAEAL